MNFETQRHRDTEEGIERAFLQKIKENLKE
jgi:hypothetical protein